MFTYRFNWFLDLQKKVIWSGQEGIEILQEDEQDEKELNVETSKPKADPWGLSSNLTKVLLNLFTAPIALSIFFSFSVSNLFLKWTLNFLCLKIFTPSASTKIPLTITIKTTATT